MHSNSALLRSLLQFSKPSSTSVLTLPYFSSSVPSCILFHIVRGQLAELKMLILNKRRRFVRLITCRTTFGQHVRELVFGVNEFDLDLRAQIDSVK